MRALHQKLLRDTWRMGGQVVTIALVVVCGIAGFVTALATWRSLTGARDDYNAAYNLADVHGTVVRAPQWLVGRLEEIDGVTAVQARVRLSIRLTVDGFPETVSALLSALPPPSVYAINALHLRSGRAVEPGSAQEAILSDNFAGAHGLKPGAQLTAYINGRPVRLHVVGVGLSPEHLYVTQPGAVLPDDRRYGVVWMDGEAVARAAGMEGAFNDVVLTCALDADLQAVKDRVTALLQPWGETGVTTRADFPSIRFVNQEMEQLRAMVTLFPVVFLGVARGSQG